MTNSINLDQADIGLTERWDRLNERLLGFDVARKRCKDLAAALVKAEKKHAATAEAQTLAQYVAQLVQQQAHDQISEVVSRCLASVFDEPYTFHINFERKRNRTEARMIFKRDGHEVDPLEASGGGVVDIAALALRLSCIILNKPPLRRLIVMDEPFRFVREQYWGRVEDLLQTLAKEMKVQFIMVSNISEWKMGTVIEL